MSGLPREILASLQEGMRPTGLDRFIAHWAPGWGRKRLEARATLAVGGGAWQGARRDLPELKNWKPVVVSPDDEQRWDRETLLARSTDLERKDALAGGAISEMVLSVVGTGLSVHPEPQRRILGWSQDQAVEWSEGVKQRFGLWAADARECDIARRRNFYQQQAIAFRTVSSRGDCFALLPRRRHPGGLWSLKVQLIEGDRCVTPKGKQENGTLSQGVEMDEFGGVNRYWFCNKHPTESGITEKDFTSVDAWDKAGNRQVLHLMHEHRLDLRRGYPLLAPVLVPLKQMSRLSESELAAAIVASFFAVVINKTGTGAGPLGPKTTQEGDGKAFAELGPAIVAELAPGESITNVAPTRTNGAFDPFWSSLVGQIAMRVQIPPEILLKKFESSYTAARGALLQFWKFVSVERENLLAPDFCQPVYEAWLAEDVAMGRTIAPGFFKDPLLRAAYCSGKWVGDNAPILDPLKEVLASQELVDYGFSTYDVETMRLTGGDFELNHERLMRQVRMRKEGGLITDLKPEAFATLDPATTDPNPSDGTGGGQDTPTTPKPSKGRKAALRDLAMRES